MNYSNLNLETMTIDELTKYITNKMDVNLQLAVVGDEYYYSFASLDEAKRKDVILSSLKQMPEDIIENIIKDGKER